MKKIFMAGLMLLAGVACAEQKPVANTNYLTIIKSRSELCQAYVDYFNAHKDFPSPRLKFIERNLHEVYSDLSPDLKIKLNPHDDLTHKNSEPRKEPRTPLSDLIEEVVSGMEVKHQATDYAYLHLGGSFARLYEAFVDIDGDRVKEHLFRYRNDQGLGVMYSVNDYKNVVFVIDDNPLGFDVDKNNRLFPNVYDYDFSCSRDLLAAKYIETGKKYF